MSGEMFTKDQALELQTEAEESLGDVLNGYLLQISPVAMGLRVAVTDLETDLMIKRVLTKEQVDRQRLNIIETASRVSIAELKDGLGI